MSEEEKERMEKALSEIKNTEEYPYCSVGLVSGKMCGQNYNGTGCLIAPNIVLTCAHNLVDRSSKKEPVKGSLKFTPGASGSNNTKPSVEVKSYYFPGEYTLEKDYQKYDIGVLELEEKLEETCGYLGIDTR